MSTHRLTIVIMLLIAMAMIYTLGMQFSREASAHTATPPAPSGHIEVPPEPW